MEENIKSILRFEFWAFLQQSELTEEQKEERLDSATKSIIKKIKVAPPQEAQE